LNVFIVAVYAVEFTVVFLMLVPVLVVVEFRLLVLMVRVAVLWRSR
jgi:hypothetical protein